MTDRFIVHHGDNMAILPTLADCSVDAIVTDPPAGISFMGKAWDSDKGGRDAWIAWLTTVMGECLRVLKPGGHALVWAIPRTSHWTGMAIENAGFEVRDRIAHVQGAGFPKSLDVSKAIDKAAGAEREVVGTRTRAGMGGSHTFAQDAWTQANRGPIELDITAPATDAARQWQGWGTALKPAIEDWWLARKPLVGNVAQNVLVHGTGALNIDGCRVEADGGSPAASRRAHAAATGNSPTRPGEYGRPLQDRTSPERYMEARAGEAIGRWPANLIHSGEPEVLAAFPQSDARPAKAALDGTGSGSGKLPDNGWGMASMATSGYADTGSAARFFMQCPPDEATSLFYTPKASRSDRDKGNTHSTVKPIALMRYLCRLITPPDGVVLDVFCGSGSTGQSAMFEGFRFIGIEADAGHIELARHRVGLAARNGWQAGLELESAA